MQSAQVKISGAEAHEFELATLVVSTSSQYSSSIQVQVEGKKVNGKSIMGMTYLALMDDDLVTVTADGADEEEALKALSGLLQG